jgi:menaquinone-dependent protoporphyrinogen oxidase
MKEKALVAYASRFGSTAEISERIAEVLRSAGIDVDLQPVDQVQDLKNYSAIILGSAVYFGGWRKDAVKFLKTREADLKDKKVWFFSSGPAGAGDPVELLDGWTFPSTQQEIADRIQPRGVAVFHGVMDKANLNFMERWMLKKMDAPMGDFRDWDLITGWAENIVGDLVELIL